MALCATGIKLGEELGHRLHSLTGCVLLAIGISLIGSVAMILHLANESGGIHLNGWFFGGGTRAPFGYISRGLNAPTAPNTGIWVHLYVGDGTMALLVLACQTLLWWPLNPMGYPIAKIWLIDSLWISIFLA